MLEEREHFAFNDLMEIHVLNMVRLKAEAEGKLADWLRFIKANGEEEIKMVAEKDAVIMEAYCKLQVMSEDEETRMLYEARLKAQRDEYARMQGALEEGRQSGWESGWENGWDESRLEIAQNLKNLGISIEQIAQATKLSPEEIAAL
jgi:predicted transposase/invertase (TIGR01784 family)